MKKQIYFQIAVFLVTLIIYILTLAPDVTFIDSGELAGVVSTLGIAHPSGYPLFTILGYLWLLLPLPFTNIYALNLLSAVYISLSAVCIFNISHLILSFIENKTLPLRKSKPKEQPKEEDLLKNKNSFITAISAIVAVSFGFATTIWEQATSIEVYSLQVLLLTLTLFAILKSATSQHQELKWLLLSAFLLGLSFANHLTAFLLIPPIIFLYFKEIDHKFNFSTEKFRTLLILLIPFLLGLSFYLYLFLRSASEPLFNWGYVSRSFDKFLYHLQGKQYLIWLFTSKEAFNKNFAEFFQLLPYQFGFIGLVPLIIGIFYGFKHSRDIFWFLTILILFSAIYSMNYDIPDIENYFVTSIIGLFIFFAVGLYFSAKFLKKYYPILVIIPIISIAINYSKNDKSKDYVVNEYLNILLNNIETNGIIISSQWDYFCSPFMYKQQVEGMRKDIAVVEQELLRRTWYPYQLRKWHPEIYQPCEMSVELFLQDLELFESNLPYDPNILQTKYENLLNCFINTNYGKRPIYITPEVLEKEPNIAKDYKKIPVGLAFKLEKSDSVYRINPEKINIDRFAYYLTKNKGKLVDGIKNVVIYNLSLMTKYCIFTEQFSTAEKLITNISKIDPKTPLLYELSELLNKQKTRLKEN